VTATSAYRAMVLLRTIVVGNCEQKALEGDFSAQMFGSTVT